MNPRYCPLLAKQHLTLPCALHRDVLLSKVLTDFNSYRSLLGGSLIWTLQVLGAGSLIWTLQVVGAGQSFHAHADNARMRRPSRV